MLQRANARCGSQRRHYRRSDTSNHLHDELQCFFLCHSQCLMFNLSLGFAAWHRQECLIFNVSCFMFNVKAGV